MSSNLNNTNAPLASSHMNTDNNDLSKPSIGKTGLSTMQAAKNQIAHNAPLATGTLGELQAVHDPLTLTNIEQRGAMHSTGLTGASAAVMQTLHAKENNVLLGAAREINELQQKDHAAMMKSHSNVDSNISEIQRREHENIAKIAAEKEAKIAALKKEEAEKIAAIQRREQEEIAKLQNQSTTGVKTHESKIHEIAVDAKQKLEAVRATEGKVVQNLSAAEQLRAMAHEREVLAEAQNSEANAAQGAATTLHAQSLKAAAAAAAAAHTASTHSTTANKLDSHRPVVQQTTTTTTVVDNDRLTRGA